MFAVSLNSLSIDGAYTFTTPAHEDARGAFAVLFSQQAWTHHHLNPSVAQVNYVQNPHIYTLRGMHYQLAPVTESKTIRCLSGTLYDVIVDLRFRSPTYRHWCSVTLSAPTDAVYVPEGCAHGYLTLTPDTTVLYTTSKHYVPEAAHGVRWNDPAFNITWPTAPLVIAERDATYPDYYPQH
jgi:dTDP-4-dehydrorhamnose 3,5-epimerase